MQTHLDNELLSALAIIYEWPAPPPTRHASHYLKLKHFFYSIITQEQFVCKWLYDATYWTQLEFVQYFLALNIIKEWCALKFSALQSKFNKSDWYYFVIG